MFHIVLYEPEIAPNTGNIIRLCANTGAFLHLVGPLGFSMNDQRLRRAGLDYHEFAAVRQHDSMAAFLRNIQPPRLLALSTRGATLYTAVDYLQGDALLFGPETRGLPDDILGQLPAGHILRVPMRPHSRSLNLANTAAVVLYEAWRQHDFGGCR